jgi:hypothetical protein
VAAVTTKVTNHYQERVTVDTVDHQDRTVLVVEAQAQAAKTQDLRAEATAVTEDRVRSREQTIIGQAVQAAAGIQAMVHNHTEALAA